MEEGIRVQDVKKCALCNKEGELLYQSLKDRLFRVGGMWSLMCCQTCDLVWLNPRPLPDDVSKLYKEYYTHQVKNAATKVFASVRRAIKANILRRDYGYFENTGKEESLGSRLLSWIGPLKEIVGGSAMYLKANERGKILDVGCGNGRFLAQMRELGWEVMGVEPDPKAARIAREEFGVKVFQGTLQEAKFPNDHFDAITMNHVIEHVPDPIELLSECRRILKPSGRLVVVTPNARSIGRRLFGEHWLHWDPPRHLFPFSPKSLRACAERAGLVVQALWTASKSARSTWVASRLIRRKGELPGGSPRRESLQLKLEGLIFWALEYFLCRFGWFGEEVVLRATKEKV